MRVPKPEAFSKWFPRNDLSTLGSPFKLLQIIVVVVVLRWIRCASPVQVGSYDTRQAAPNVRELTLACQSSLLALPREQQGFFVSS